MNNTNLWTTKAQEIAINAENTIMNIEKLNEDTSNTLKRATDYIQTEGATALAKAISKSDELGQQSDQMSEIARGAREFVGRYVVFILFLGTSVLGKTIKLDTCSFKHRVCYSCLYDLFSFLFRKQKEIEDMKAIAEQAINISSEAYEITKNAANQQKNIRYVIMSIYYKRYTGQAYTRFSVIIITPWKTIINITPYILYEE